MQKKISSIILDSISTKELIYNNENLKERISDSVELISNTFKKGNKVFFCGNGGSAADAQHLAAEFSGRFYKDRRSLPSEALHCNTSYLTAVGNDYSFDLIYSRLLEGIATKGDVLIGITTSGNSQNIVNAFLQAKKMGVYTIGLTGSSGGELKVHSDILVNVPSFDTPRIQESHIMIGHIICQIVEENLFP
jgi:D-sedoheptulose 7-phosphate isomerase